MHPTTPRDRRPRTSSGTSQRFASVPHRNEGKALAAVPSSAAPLRRAKVAVLCRTTTTARNAEPVDGRIATHCAHQPRDQLAVGPDAIQQRRHARCRASRAGRLLSSCRRPRRDDRNATNALVDAAAVGDRIRPRDISAAASGDVAAGPSKQPRRRRDRFRRRGATENRGGRPAWTAASLSCCDGHLADGRHALELRGDPGNPGAARL
jgi:hypothetical protein